MKPSLPRITLRLSLAATLVAGACAALFVARPLPAGLLDRRPVTAVRFTDRTGLLLREVASRADGRAIPLPAGWELVRDARYGGTWVGFVQRATPGGSEFSPA